MHATAAKPGYHRELASNWWLKNRHYTMYMIREFTAVFAALWTLIFVIHLPQLTHDVDAWIQFASSPLWVLFSLVSLVFVVFHAYTAFNATGTLIYLRMGEKPVPGSTLNGMMFLGWAVVTIVFSILLVLPGM